MHNSTEKLRIATETYISEDYQSAYKLLLPLAENGIADAQFLLALMLRDGEGVSKDEIASKKWIQKIHFLAENGDLNAQWLLGRKYQFGDVLPLNEDKALSWYHAAAEKGHAEAQFHLSRLYQRGGCGIEQDNEKASHWFECALKQHHPEALYVYFLDNIYSKNSSDIDLTLLIEAADADFEPAVNLLREINKKKKNYS